ncbi:MAG: Chromosomal replication initiator protein DnaA [Deltaproteobacteria bacterium ADurb.Bin151]|jgi:chromosomal replication initiator protein|nr:chromosomal replication initiator protein DnaA [Smithella sp.]OQB54055.1 MAG: Chromosomal replication initiator protein DnaA [Deltaproteobacteria bacterium ADurb.Bin151]HNZ10829.1 chromosomal replication initiator protein DnaA [Smithellaceae bacterium]HQP24504.1 chromosomal replication initiator protein DnaA [Smithellaceae bacterium]HRY34985.1 chromosomal replication initiator protein DnaA [Smithellaceae bacterium]
MESVWDKATKIIQEKVSKQNFDTWIKPIKILAMEDKCIQLAVPNKFFKDWLMDNYLSMIKNTLQSVIGISVDIDFILSRDKEKKPEAAVLPFDQDRNHPGNNHASRNKNISFLNGNYTFDRFVVGPSNQFAHAASIAVAKQPAKNYNPLFIYGGSGLGKTHLLNAIGLMTTASHPELNVMYVSAEAFMNEMINSIRYDRMSKFREKYRNIGSLLIDDIHFLAGKDRTQEEFFHTFNTLHDSGKQIVVTSDKFPKDIPNLEGRLRSRFEWGLIADIQPPEIETKIAIIEKKMHEIKIDLSPAVAHYIASHVESNIRELEGFLIRISAYSSLTNREINLDLVKEVLKKLVKHNNKEEVSVEEIIKVVAGKMNVKIADIKAHNKNKNLVLARQVSMYLARKLTNFSYPDIGQKIGGRDHSTVIYANNKILKSMESNVNFSKLVQDIEDSIINKS